MTIADRLEFHSGELFFLITEIYKDEFRFGDVDTLRTYSHLECSMDDLDELTIRLNTDLDDMFGVPDYVPVHGPAIMGVVEFRFTFDDNKVTLYGFPDTALVRDLCGLVGRIIHDQDTTV